mmetsp:Transcript_3421/g.10559  ORF Transcript_3421/g.10559 Transcript_3421/m.10559 type:complete len:291 (-) Transcript_3421:1324-2196(-)
MSARVGVEPPPPPPPPLRRDVPLPPPPPPVGRPLRRPGRDAARPAETFGAGCRTPRPLDAAAAAAAVIWLDRRVPTARGAAAAAAGTRALGSGDTCGDSRGDGGSFSLMASALRTASNVEMTSSTDRGSLSSVPTGILPEGHRPFSLSTPSRSSRRIRNIIAILPTARILERMALPRFSETLDDGVSFRMIEGSSVNDLARITAPPPTTGSARRRAPSSAPPPSSPSSGSAVMTVCNISTTFSPTNGSDHVKTSIKLGSQYGWGACTNCLIFRSAPSSCSTAALLLYTSR